MKLPLQGAGPCEGDPHHLRLAPLQAVLGDLHQNPIPQFILSTVAESEPVKPKLFETWSRSLFNRYLLQTVLRMLK